MRPSMSKTLILFALLVSALPVFAMAILLWSTKSEIREISDDQFDKIAVKATRQMAEDSMRICRIIFRAQSHAAEAAAASMRARFAELGSPRLVPGRHEVLVFSQNNKLARERVKIPALRFGNTELKLNFSGDSSIESSSGKIKEVLDSLKSDTGLDFSLFVKMGEGGEMLRVASTYLDLSNKEYVGAYIPSSGADGGELVRTLLAKKNYSGATHPVDAGFLAVYEPLVSDMGEVVGAVAYGRPQNAMNSILKYFESMRFGVNGFVWAVELAGKGESIHRVSRDGKLNGITVENDTFKERRDALLEIIDNAVSQGDAKVVVRQFKISPNNRNEEDAVIAYFFFKPWNMVFGATVYRGDFDGGVAAIEASAQKFLYLLVPVGLLMLAFAAIPARLAAVRGVKMIGILIRGARLMEKGNISEARSEFQKMIDSREWSNSEIYELSVSLNKMAETLTRLVSNVQAGAVNLADAAGDISNASLEIEGVASDRGGRLESLSGTINSISKSAVLLNSDAIDAADSISASLAVVGDGKSLVARLDENVVGLLEATEAVAARLAIIKDKTDRILSVVALINGVSDKTNMLALNAAMEAERAGEIEGFEVVSKEMRVLADRTSVSALHISRMAEAMRDSVESGVSELELFTSRVKGSSLTIEKVSGAIASTQERVAELGPKFEMLARGVSVYAAGVSKIRLAMDDLISAARQTREIVGDIADLTDFLKSTSDSLEEKVSRFKL